MLPGSSWSSAPWMTAGEANPFIADLVRLGEALERVRPNARTFVRPGFDEPEAAARLLAGQGGPL